MINIAAIAEAALTLGLFIAAAYQAVAIIRETVAHRGADTAEQARRASPEYLAARAAQVAAWQAFHASRGADGRGNADLFRAWQLLAARR